MGKYFGTDGIRGVAYEKLNDDLAYKVGQAVASILHPSQVVIGMDTRESSKMLEESMTNGLLDAGIDVILAGVNPTPMIAHYAKINKLVGIMITASHNPYMDNGIKIFDQGYKMLEDDEQKIEDYIDHGKKILKTRGQIIPSNDIKCTYLKIYENLNLKKTNLKIGFDSANGANYQISREIFDYISKDSIQINNTPNGRNINLDCGSTHLEPIISLVTKNSLDIGFSFDGDGDRIVVVDHKGKVYDGDLLIYIIASYLKNHNLLSKDTVVLTKMSNLGILKGLKDQGISYVLTDIGDKYVSHELYTNDYTIGGESSGHIILTRLLHTGDGLLVAIYLTKILTELNRSLEELIADIDIYPLIQYNMKNMDKRILNKESVISKIAETKKQLGEPSLLLVRPSGTEPLVRFTISSKDQDKNQTLLNELTSFIIKESETL